ncbi:UbiD family decarboxylase [Chloroflexota bacterium]
MPFKGVREFITKLEKEGEAQRIEEEVDWNLEAGAMIRRSNERGLPAPFFQEVKGYPDGYRLFGEVLGNHRRVAIAMDMAPDTPVKELIEEYLCRKQRAIKPVLVDDGPCKENIHVGDEVDLLKFPVPKVHDGDGGRYIGTFHLTISKDLDSGWVNWGMYRHMLHDKNTVGVLSSPHTHLGVMRTQQYEPSNKTMEIAIAIGVEPISAFCAASPIPYGVSEADVAGGIRGESVELVKCETVGLTVPATAEIVIEGEIKPGETRDEGPFGEYTGYMAGHRGPRPVIHVKAVTHRNNPILTMGCEGIPVTNSHIIMSVTRAAEFLEILRARGLPVSSVSEPAEGAQTVAVVAVKAGGRADDVAHAIWASRAGSGTPYVIVVEDDVDPFNLAEVFHALVTKCHPYRGITRLEHATGATLLPWLTKHEQKYLLAARAYFDCTWPVDWEPSDIPKRSSFDNIYPLGVQQEALAKWQKYGY